MWSILSSSREEYIDQSDTHIFKDLCLNCLSQYLTKQVDLLRQMTTSMPRLWAAGPSSTRPGESNQRLVLENRTAQHRIQRWGHVQIMQQHWALTCWNMHQYIVLYLQSNRDHRWAADSYGGSSEAGGRAEGVPVQERSGSCTPAALVPKACPVWKKSMICNKKSESGAKWRQQIHIIHISIMQTPMHSCLSLSLERSTVCWIACLHLYVLF